MKHPGNQYVGDCPDCGKHQFNTRRDAKRAARFLHPEDNQRPYRCGQFWHYGHTPRWMTGAWGAGS